MSKKYDDAIGQYSFALSLDPPNKAGLFIKRSKARAAMGSWQEALDDADMVWLLLALCLGGINNH